MRNFILIIMVMGFVLSCDTKDPSNTSTSASQEISLQIIPKLDGIEAKVNQYYHLKNGDSIYFSRLDFFMQTINFKDKSGKVARLDTAFLFSNKNAMNKLNFKSTSLPTTIDTINFLCGLGDITNSLDPLKYDADHPLSSYKNMYWTMGSKYRFIVFEGNIKTASGSMIPFSYHTGLEYKYSANIPVNITLNVSNPKTYTLGLHLERIFYPTNGIAVDYKNSETQAHGDASDGPLTDKVALNFSRAFIME
ncbi:MAG: MbnP family protein [Chitinophagales bacterium]|nr:hypothetical protein [Sphingobacteriales bacterium]